MPSTDVRHRSARSVVVRGLGAVEQLASKSRKRLQSGATEQSGVSDSSPDEGGTVNYGGFWNPPTEEDAMEAIYNTQVRASFEEGGQLDFARLKQWVNPESTVLDLGCGIGRVALYVAPACAKLWAVDVSPRMLEMARVRLADQRNVQYAICQDVVIPDVPTASIDVAYSLLVLQHLEREDAFLLLQELRRIMRPTGTAVLSFPNLLSETYLASFREYARTRVSSVRSRARFYTAQEVECVLGAAGFKADLEVGTEIYAVATPA